MQLPNFAKDPKPVLGFLVGAAGLIALYPALGGQITHDEAEIIALALGALALLSGVIAASSAVRDYIGAGGTPADLNRAGLALVVFLIGLMLVLLGAQAAFAVSHSQGSHAPATPSRSPSSSPSATTYPTSSPCPTTTPTSSKSATPTPTPTPMLKAPPTWDGLAGSSRGLGPRSSAGVW